MALRLTVPKPDLLSAVNAASKFLGRDSEVAILGGMLLDARDGTLEVSATDLQRSVRIGVRADIEDEGSTVVSGRLLPLTVKNMRSGDVRISTEGTELELRSGKSTYHLHTLSPRNFPSLSVGETSQALTIGSSTLCEMVDKVKVSVARDSYLPVLNGIRLVASGGTLTAVAVDAHRLMVVETEVGSDAEFDVVILASGLADALSVIPPESEVSISAGEGQVTLEAENVRLVTRRLVGRFPDHTATYPRVVNLRASVEPKELADTVRRMSVLASPTMAVSLAFDGSDLTVSASDKQQGDASESMQVVTDGDPMTVTYNARYLVDALDQTDGEAVIELASEMQPGLVRSRWDGGGFVGLLMPVRP